MTNVMKFVDVPTGLDSRAEFGAPNSKDSGIIN